MSFFDYQFCLLPLVKASDRRKIKKVQCESVRAQICLSIKNLKQYKYHPDKQKKAIQTVIDQAVKQYREWVVLGLLYFDINSGRKPSMILGTSILSLKG
jgi:hypothetical protein